MTFRPPPDVPFGGPPPEPEVLRLSFTSRGVGLELNLNGREDLFALERTALTTSRDAGGEASAYGRVLRGVLTGDHTLSVSAVESEEGWRIVEPVLAAWAAGEVPLLEYAAGSAGPA